MKELHDEDIELTLKFGNSSRINVKKLSDSISQNSCYVEKISTKRESMGSDDAKSMASMGSISSISVQNTKSVTRGIFVKSLSERMGIFAASFQSSSPPRHPSSKQAAINDLNNIESQCSTCMSTNPQTYQFKLSVELEEDWFPICAYCRNKLVSVCDVWSFLRGYKAGVYKEDRHQLFAMFVEIRKAMFYARVGLDVNNTGVKRFIQDTSRHMTCTYKPKDTREKQELLNDAAITKPVEQSHSERDSPTKSLDLENDNTMNDGDITNTEPYDINHFEL